MENKDIENQQENIIDEKQNKKSNRNILLAIISILILIILIICISKKEKNVAIKVVEAFGNTITMSLNENSFVLSQIYDLNNNYTYNVKDNIYEELDIEASFTSNNNERELKLTIIDSDFGEENVVTAFTDKGYLYLSFLDSDLKKIKIEKLKESEFPLIKFVAKYEEYKKAIETLGNDLKESIVDTLSASKYEKLPEITQSTPNGSVVLEGYSFSISIGDFLNFLESSLNKIKEDEEISELIDDLFFMSSLYYSEETDSIDEYIDGYLEIINFLREEFNEYENINEELELINIEAYLYDDYIAKFQIKTWDIFELVYYDDDIDGFYSAPEYNAEIFTYETAFGNYPLENATFTHSYRGETDTINLQELLPYATDIEGIKDMLFYSNIELEYSDEPVSIQKPDGSEEEYDIEEFDQFFSRGCLSIISHFISLAN